MTRLWKEGSFRNGRPSRRRWTRALIRCCRCLCRSPGASRLWLL